MYTKEQIDEIILELCLDLQDDSVRKTIEQILKLKPNVPIDQNFIASLRQELANKANIKEATRSASSNSNQFNFISSFMNKVLAGALVVMVLVAGGGLWYIQQTNKPLFNGNIGAGQELLSGKFAVKDSQAESFGDLSKLSIIPAEEMSSLKMAAPAGGGFGGGGSNASSAEPMPVEPDGGIGSDGDRLMAPAPDNYIPPVQYVFKYNGDTLPTLPDAQGVLKRSEPIQPSGIVSRIISFLSFGLIDLNKLSNAQISNLSISEDKEYGYDVSMDLRMGNVFFYKNWLRWPDDSYNCMEVGCVNPKVITESELPKDDEAIAIAEQFISDYGISKESYGSPVINDQWRVQYNNAPAGSNWYIPEQVQVIYPLVLEGKEIIDEGGFVYGMSLYIDARTKRVTSVSELITKQFERSSYKGETDTNKIIKLAENGGFRNASYEDPSAKKVQLNLGTPTIQTVKMWYSADNYKSNSELYVPALVFPVKNWKETNYWRANIYVPLVQDILNSDNQYPPVMPLDLPVKSEPTPAIMPEATTNGAE